MKKSEGCVYKYKLFSRKREDGTLFSVGAEMVTDKNVKTSSMVFDIFSDFEAALAFLLRMAEYLATPKNLPYIVEDEVTG